MSFRLYVGNYPFDFSEEDVKNLFQDFEGLVFEREVRKEPKCYAFFSCNDMDLLVSVIQKMSNVDVGGRRLIVRALEHSVQEYVDVLLKDTGKSDKNLNSEQSSSLVPIQVMKHSVRSPLKHEKNEESTSSSLSNDHELKYRQPLEDKSSYRASHGSYRQNRMKNSRELSERVSCSSSTSQDYQNCRKSSDDESSPIKDENPQYHGRKYPTHYDTHLEKNAYYEEDGDEDLTIPETDCESLHSAGTWVSVSNFPYYTTTESIYKLFSDYEPLKVFMVCNEPNKEGLLTEAHVCFPNQDVVDDIVMNFDNTFYKGRLLLVNDMEDLSVLDELLVVSSC